MVPVALALAVQAINPAAPTVNPPRHDMEYFVSPISSPNEGYFFVDSTSTLSLYYAAEQISFTPPEPRFADMGVIVKRISELSALRQGWLDDKALAPSPAVLAWLNSNAPALALASNPVTIVPLGDGGVALHWNRSDVEYTAELHEDELYMVTDNVSTDELEDSTGPLSTDAFRAFLTQGVMA
jgi:hypothetical protein